MLNDRLARFHELVESARSRVGDSPPRITDEIMAVAFPRTSEEAWREGADKMLRRGVIGAVSEAIRRPARDARQRDMAEVEETFGATVAETMRRLHSDAYYVPSRGEQVAVLEMVEQPELLNEARTFMRQKGLECLEEARTLDDLYAAVATTDD